MIGTELFQHADQLTKFARFRHHNSPSAQLFRHVQTFIPRRYETATRYFRDYANISVTQLTLLRLQLDGGYGDVLAGSSIRRVE